MPASLPELIPSSVGVTCFFGEDFGFTFRLKGFVGKACELLYVCVCVCVRARVCDAHGAADAIERVLTYFVRRWIQECMCMYVSVCMYVRMYVCMHP